MGKSQFLDLSDVSGRLQVYINLKETSAEQAGIFQLLDIGDFLGVEGEVLCHQDRRTDDSGREISNFVEDIASAAGQVAWG